MPEFDSTRYDFGRHYTLLRKKLEDHIHAHDNPHQVEKAQLNLGNVDNTSDIDKPLSTAQKTYIDSSTGASLEVIEDFGRDLVTIRLVNLNGEIISEESFYYAQASLNNYSDLKNILSRAEKKNDYLYSINYKYLDYDLAERHFQTYEDHQNFSGSIILDNIAAHNHSSLYNFSEEFVVKTASLNKKDDDTIEINNGRYATLGVASNTPYIDRNCIENENPVEELKLIPFFIVDGINEKGLFCSLDYVTKDFSDNTSGTTPSDTLEDIIHMRMLPRYILDNFKSVDETIEYLQQHVSIYANSGTSGCEYHITVSDSTKACLIEFKRNNIIIVNGINIVTNFSLNDVTLSDNHAYTPYLHFKEDKDPVDQNINTYGYGLERFNILADTTTSDLVTTLNNSLKFTFVYTSDAYEGETTPVATYWYSDFIFRSELEDNPDISSMPIAFEPYITSAKELFENKDRTQNNTYQSMHNSIYNLNNLSLVVYNQEKATAYNFSL